MQRPDTTTIFLGYAPEKAVNLCGMACCHDTEASPVYATCLSGIFSQQLP